MGQLHAMDLSPVTAVGDEFTAIGVLCEVCGETTVTMPERLVPERGWFGCDRCSTARRRQVREKAPEVFADNGLDLADACRGEFMPQRATCMDCGTERRVSYRELVDGTAPLCWVCTHGIRVDEPHRLYLVRFPELGVWKVGITHARHDRRLADHQIRGAQVVQVVTVLDRPTALSVERQVIASYAPWRATALTSAELPQGGWTETWVDHPAAPRCDLTVWAS